MKAHSVKPDPLEPGGDGLVVYNVGATYVFRLWEIKKHHANGPVSGTINRASKQLASRGNEYLAKLAGPDTVEQRGSSGAFYASRSSSCGWTAAIARESESRWARRTTTRRRGRRRSSRSRRRSRSSQRPARPRACSWPCRKGTVAPRPERPALCARRLSPWLAATVRRTRPIAAGSMSDVNPQKRNERGAPQRRCRRDPWS